MKDLNKRVVFFVLFTLLGLVSLQVSFNKLAGSNVSFTLFDFFAPIAGAFLGPVYGIVSVFSVMVTNNLIKDVPWTTASIIRLFPTLFAVFYFAMISRKKGKWILVVPVLAIIAFVIHPIGRQVPYYALMFWSIPLIAYRFRNNLWMKSLGATFTAHSVGGMMWIWIFNLPVTVWQSLIPVVIAERLLFACGISISYIIARKVLILLVSKHILPKNIYPTDFTL